MCVNTRLVWERLFKGEHKLLSYSLCISPEDRTNIFSVILIQVSAH